MRNYSPNTVIIVESRGSEVGSDIPFKTLEEARNFVSRCSKSSEQYLLLWTGKVWETEYGDTVRVVTMKRGDRVYVTLPLEDLYGDEASGLDFRSPDRRYDSASSGEIEDHTYMDKESGGLSYLELSTRLRKN